MRKQKSDLREVRLEKTDLGSEDRSDCEKSEVRLEKSDMDVWKKSLKLTNDVYLITKDFPKEEVFGITNQIRRSAVSIPSNISEGCGRDKDKQVKYFLDVAIGSTCELETQFNIAVNISYIEKEQFIDIVAKIIEVRKMIIGFKKSLI